MKCRFCDWQAPVGDDAERQRATAVHIGRVHHYALAPLQRHAWDKVKYRLRAAIRDTKEPEQIDLGLLL